MREQKSQGTYERAGTQGAMGGAQVVLQGREKKMDRMGPDLIHSAAGQRHMESVHGMKTCSLGSRPSPATSSSVASAEHAASCTRRLWSRTRCRKP